MRTGAYKYINAVEVREGEIKRDKFTGITEFLKENPEGEVIGYLASFELLTGFKQSVYMTSDEIEKHAMKYSQAYRSDKKYNKMTSKWSDPDERDKMALKTVFKTLLSKYGVLSVEMQTAMSNDSDDEIIDSTYEEMPKGSRATNVEAEVKDQPEPGSEQSGEKQVKI